MAAANKVNNNTDVVRGNILAEKLIATVARAFYTDLFVVVLDTLLREKFIREEELGPRLKMTSKEARKILQQLEAEMFVRYETLIMDDKRHSKCYYIDYQLFVAVVRYRVFLMREELKETEKLELTEVYYECPTCKQRYSSLDVQRLLSADFKFICPSCCPHENFRTAESQPFFRLISVDNRGKLSNVQILSKKMDIQLSRSREHEGIYDLLQELKDVTLIRNRPSDNRIRGLGSSAVTDEDVRDELKDVLGSKRAIKESKIRQLGLGGSASELKITFDEDAQNADEPAAKKVREVEYPEFLLDSRVLSATEVQALHDSGAPVAVVPSSNNSNSIANNKVSENSVGAAAVTLVEEEGEDDDVNWED